MKNRRAWLMTVILFCSPIGVWAQTAPQLPGSKQGGVNLYDPGRDAEKDLRNAEAEAQRSGKRIFVEVGGNWCVWCRTMENFFGKNASLLDLREKNFILVKVNFSPENRNQKLLSKFPAIKGYPHIFILDPHGQLLHSQDTSELEEGKSYNLEKFMAFLKKWSDQ